MLFMFLLLLFCFCTCMGRAQTLERQRTTNKSTWNFKTQSIPHNLAQIWTALLRYIYFFNSVYYTHTHSLHSLYVVVAFVYLFHSHFHGGVSLALCVVCVCVWKIELMISKLEAMFTCLGVCIHTPEQFLLVFFSW